VNRLLDHGVDPSADDNYAIRLAAANGQLGVVNRLLEDARVDPSASDNYALIQAAKNGYLDVVNRLLVHPNVDPSARDNEAIIWAAENGHLDVVNRLLDHGVDPSASDNYAILFAATNGQLGVVNRLLEDARVDPSADNNYAIRLAARHGHLAVVSSLIGDSRVALILRYSDLEQLTDEDKIKSILQSIFMKNNISRKDLNGNERDSQFFSGCYDRIFRDPTVKSALQSQHMRRIIAAVSEAWKKIFNLIFKLQAQYLWHPQGPRFQEDYRGLEPELKPQPGSLKRKGSSENNRITKQRKLQ
jgi:hypothetical protein